jgi:hypothetical protein
LGFQYFAANAVHGDAVEGFVGGCQETCNLDGGIAA